jgi:hypothetical protein
MATFSSRRGFLAGLLIGGTGLATGCGWDGHFTILGYSTQDNYDHNIKTIYLPLAKNKALQTTPYREMEVELTRRIQEQIQLKTPFKIVGDPDRADTELLCTIISLNKQLMNRTEQNEVREGELQVGAMIVWRDLRTGKVLSNAPKTEGVLLPTELVPFDPDNPPKAEDPDVARPVLVRAPGRYLPEVGESNATAQTRVCNYMAVQIVSMLEKPWKYRPKPVAPPSCPPE